MSIRAKLEEFKTFMLAKLEELAAEAEKVVPAVEAGAAAVAAAVPGVAPIAAAVEKVGDVVAAVVCDVCGHAHDGVCTCGCSRKRTS